MNTSSNAAQTAASATSPIPATEHAAWCRGHHDEGEDWCTSRPIEVGDTYLDVTTGNADRQPLLAGLDQLPDAVDLDTAEQLARAVLELIDEARRAPEHHSWCDDPEHNLHGDRCSSHVVDFTSTKPGDDSTPVAGWWGWLAARAEDDLVSLVVEGRPLWADESFASLSFEVPVWHVSALRDVLGDDRGRTALNDLLKRLPR